jgi:hypothetical protein
MNNGMREIWSTNEYKQIALSEYTHTEDVYILSAGRYNDRYLVEEPIERSELKELYIVLKNIFDKESLTFFQLCDIINGE